MTLPFQLSEHGNPIIAASIEGVQGNFLVDTGMNGGLSVSHSFVQSNHLRDKYPRHIEDQGGMDLTGKSGTAWYVRSDQVMLSRTLPIHNTILILEDHDLMQDGSIGGFVLQQFTLTVDWPHKQFYLEKNRLYGQKPFISRPGFTPGTAPDGFNIAVVIPNSPADEAGLHVGDQLVEIAGQSTRTMTFAKLRDLARGEPGKKLPVTVERDGKRLSVVLTLRDLL